VSAGFHYCALAEFIFCRFEMAREIDKLVVGTRFKMSKLGDARCPELANLTGIVVEVSQSNTGVTVLFDGAKRATCLHRQFISPVSGIRPGIHPARSEKTRA
jgi:hypothetical protein